MRQAELERIEAAARGYPAAYELFRDRHKRNEQLGILVEVTTAWLSPNALVVLQAEELATMAAKGVVIETLPTSNVRISVYDSLKDHHLFRWLNLTEGLFSSVPRSAWEVTTLEFLLRASAMNMRAFLKF